METSAKVPPPVKTWWYAGKSIGYEFIYPRKQALELAKATSEPILTTAKETTDFEGADLSRDQRSRVPAAVKVEQKPAPREASGRAQPADATRRRAPAPARTPRRIRAPMNARVRRRARSCRARRARYRPCLCWVRSPWPWGSDSRSGPRNRA